MNESFFGILNTQLVEITKQEDLFGGVFTVFAGPITEESFVGLIDASATGPKKPNMGMC